MADSRNNQLAGALRERTKHQRGCKKISTLVNTVLKRCEHLGREQLQLTAPIMKSLKTLFTTLDGKGMPHCCKRTAVRRRMRRSPLRDSAPTR